MKPLNAGHILILVLIGIIAASYLSVEDISRYTISIKKSFDFGSQKQIDIDLSSENVELIVDDIDTFEIHYEDVVLTETQKESLEKNIVIQDANSEIQIYKKDTVYIRGNVFSALGYLLRYGRIDDTFQGKVTVTIPKAYAEDISVNLSSGNVSLADFSGRTLNLTTSSGGITMDHIDCEMLKAVASSGNVKASNIVASTSLRVETSSGNKRLSNIQTKDFTSNGSSGELRLSGNVESAKIQTSSGSVDLTDFVAGNLKITASSGDINVEGSLDNLDAKTSSGGINILTDVLVGSYQLKATSGNIKFDVPDDIPFKFISNTSSGDYNTKMNLDYKDFDDDYARGYYLDEDTKISIEMESSSGNQTLK